MEGSVDCNSIDIRLATTHSIIEYELHTHALYGTCNSKYHYIQLKAEVFNIIIYFMQSRVGIYDVHKTLVWSLVMEATGRISHSGHRKSCRVWCISCGHCIFR